MPFFRGSVGNFTPPTTKETNYTSADYYIANTPEKAKEWQIPDNNGGAVLNSIDTSVVKGNNGPSDYGDYYSKARAAKLFIRHLATGYSVAFPAILDAYDESFSVNFNAEQVYGRMDPIQRYQNTSRKINVSWKVLAYDEDHAHRNGHALSALTQFLYPVYDDPDGTCSNASVIRESPLLRIRFANLMQKNARTKEDNPDMGENYINNGLLVAPSSFAYAPNLEAGFFVNDNVHLFAKEIKISMNFTVVHEETLGWRKADVNSEKRYHWIGKLNASGSGINGATDFPWGNDETENNILARKKNAGPNEDPNIYISTENLNSRPPPNPDDTTIV